MIELVGVTHHYGVRPVLRGVNLKINPGELVAVVGPNGMGKSTLLGVIGGTLTPIRGYVQIDGLQRRGSPDEETRIRRRVIYLPDRPWLPEARTGREWLLAMGELYEVNADRVFDHVDRLLELFELTHQADAPIRSYSTGQQKKLALCAALVSEAPIMILDEPFSGGLDPSGLVAIKRVLAHLAARDDVTVLIASPVPELVEEVADRVVVLKDGQVAAFESVADLCASTTEPNLAAALGKLIFPDTEHHLQRYFARPAVNGSHLPSSGK